MQIEALKTIVRKKPFPNWVVTFAIIATICLINVYIISASSADTSVQRVQIVYQLSLVVAGAIGLPLAVWRSWTAHRQAITGQKQLEGFQKQLMILEAGAEADRLQKGTELLDSEKMVVRIAGVAILRSIANKPEHNFKSEAFRVLNAFASHSAEQEEENGKSIENYNTPEDIQEALRALLGTRHITNQRIGSMQIFGVSLQEAYLSPDTAVMLQFVRGNFNNCTIKNDTFFAFSKVRFYDCEIETGTNDFTTYDDCIFIRCKFSGKAYEGFEQNNRFRGGDTESLGLKKKS